LVEGGEVVNRREEGSVVNKGLRGKILIIGG
jgi:hypothetical protein